MELIFKDDREGRIIRNHRIELGLTQEHAVMELGMSLQLYQRYEYGERRFSNCPMRIGLRIYALVELDPYEVIGIV